MGFSVGAVDYVVKPFQIDEVMARIHMHLIISETHQRLTKINTHLKQTINAHPNSNAELSLLKFSIENSSEPILWLTSEGHIDYINTAACILLNNKRENLLSLHFSDIDANSAVQHWPECWLRIKILRTHTTETVLQVNDSERAAVVCKFDYTEFAGIERVVIYLRHKDEI
jgi:PAS domain-containing protein